ncbi:MAG: hypothetical protein ACRD3D_13200 [Terriglobia bacterium]
MPLVETIERWPGQVKRQAKKPAAGRKRVTRVPSRRARNVSELAEAQRLYETFQGRAADQVTTLDEPDAAREDLAALGWLIELVFYPRSRNTEPLDVEELGKVRRPKETETRDWDDVASDLGVSLVVLNFEHDKVCVASNAAGTQLYLVGGNQDVSGTLDEFDADDTKDFIELGDLAALTYLASKAQSNFEPMEWEHVLGEESGIAPFGYWNKLERRIYLVGGEYRVEEPGLIN